MSNSQWHSQDCWFFWFFFIFYSLKPLGGMYVLVYVISIKSENCLTVTVNDMCMLDWAMGAI